MVGLINNKLVFEFRDEEQLCYAISSFMEKQGFETCAILNRSRVPIAIIKNGDYLKAPKTIQEDTEYIIYANNLGFYEDPSNITTPPKYTDEISYPFIFTICRVPKALI